MNRKGSELQIMYKAWSWEKKLFAIELQNIQSE